MTDDTPKKSMMYGFISIVSTLIALTLFGFAAFGLSLNEPGEIIWFAGMIMMMAIRIPYSAKNKDNQIVASKKGLGEKTLLTGMFITMNILPLLYLATSLFEFADYNMPDLALIIGSVIQLPFLIMFWRAHKDLGKNWSAGLEVREEHTLVTIGVYSKVRHPMYTAIWLSVIAQPLLIQNWIAGALVVPAFAALYFMRVPQEEAMMHETFGDQYNEYIKKTGRLLPKVKL